MFAHQIYPNTVLSGLSMAPHGIARPRRQRRGELLQRSSGHRAFSRAGHTAKHSAIQFVDARILTDSPLMLPAAGRAARCSRTTVPSHQRRTLLASELARGIALPMAALVSGS